MTGVQTCALPICEPIHSPELESEPPVLPVRFTHKSTQALLRTMLLPAPLVKTIALYLPLPKLWDDRFKRLWDSVDPNEATISAFDFIDEIIEEGGLLLAFDAAQIPAPIPHRTWCDWKQSAKPNTIWSNIDNNDNMWIPQNGNAFAPQRIPIISSLPPQPRDVKHPTICELRRLVGYTSVLSQYQFQTEIVAILSDQPYHMPRILIDKLINISDIASTCRRCCINNPYLSSTMNDEDTSFVVRFDFTAATDIIALVDSLRDWYNDR